jgi:hypothetical protein
MLRINFQVVCNVNAFDDQDLAIFPNLALAF